MTTTDQLPTMEQRLREEAEWYKKFLAKHEELLKYNLHELPFSKENTRCSNSTMNYQALAEANFAGINIDGVASVEYSQLSKNNRLRLPRYYDGCRKFIPVLYPGEEIESVTCFLQIPTPKDPKTLEKWLKDENPENYEWIYHPEDIVKKYIPIFTVKNVTGPFDFGHILWLPVYTCMSIEVKYVKTRLERHTFGVEGITLHHQQRKDTKSIEEVVFVNREKKGHIQIGPTVEDLARASMLEKMRTCPVCGLYAIKKCNCDLTESTCSKGHSWFYEKETGKIVIGTGHRH